MKSGSLFGNNLEGTFDGTTEVLSPEFVRSD
jgi:hypothetical protein